MQDSNNDMFIRLSRYLFFHAACLGAIVIPMTFIAFYTFLAVFPIYPSGNVDQMNKAIYSTIGVILLIMILYWVTVWFSSDPNNKYGMRSFFRKSSEIQNE